MAPMNMSTSRRISISADCANPGASVFGGIHPWGPIRIEYGMILDPQDLDNTSGQWEFTMGNAF